MQAVNKAINKPHTGLLILKLGGKILKLVKNINKVGEIKFKNQNKMKIVINQKIKQNFYPWAKLINQVIK